MEASATALASALASVAPGRQSKSALQATGGRVPILSRDFGELGEVKDKTKTGKSKFVRNQKSANDKINRSIAAALKSAKVDGKFGPQTVSLRKSK